MVKKKAGARVSATKPQWETIDAATPSRLTVVVHFQIRVNKPKFRTVHAELGGDNFELTEGKNPKQSSYPRSIFSLEKKGRKVLVSSVGLVIEGTLVRFGASNG